MYYESVDDNDIPVFLSNEMSLGRIMKFHHNLFINVTHWNKRRILTRIFMVAQITHAFREVINTLMLLENSYYEEGPD